MPSVTNRGELKIMSTQEKLIRRKQRLLERAEYLQKVSQACKISGTFLAIARPTRRRA
jgi:hypothetical protein